MTCVVAALVSVSIVLRTMNWLPKNIRVVPVTLASTAEKPSICVAVPATVAVSMLAYVFPATSLIGMYTFTVVGPLVESAELMVSVGSRRAVVRSVTVNPPAAEVSTMRKSAKPRLRVTKEYKYERPACAVSEIAAEAGTPPVYSTVDHGRQGNAFTPVSVERVGAPHRWRSCR